MDMQGLTPRPAERGAVSRRALAGVGAAAFIAFAIWLLYPRGDAPVESGPGMAPPATEAERGDTARRAIEELQQAGAPDYDQAYDRGREFQAAGRLADAQLMYFFAARAGHAEAAFELAAMYDPNHFSAGSSLMPDPDPFQAYKWYAQARDDGHPAAGERLAALREWTEQQAEQGNMEAERVLIQWE